MVEYPMPTTHMHLYILKIHWPRVVRVVEPGLISHSKAEVRRHWKSRWTKTSDFVSMRIWCPLGAMTCVFLDTSLDELSILCKMLRRLPT